MIEYALRSLELYRASAGDVACLVDHDLDSGATAGAGLYGECGIGWRDRSHDDRYGWRRPTGRKQANQEHRRT